MTIPVPVNVVVDIKQLLQCWIADDHSPENKCQIVDSAVLLMKTLQYCYHLFGSSTASQCGSCFADFCSGTLARLLILWESCSKNGRSQLCAVDEKVSYSTGS
eukprot:scpid108800/ scgid8480/ 